MDVTAEANFIWSIANKLRGSYMSDKYDDVIIPMTIIRRFECTLLDDEAKRKIVYIRVNHGEESYNFDGMIKASEFLQKKGEEHKKSNWSRIRISLPCFCRTMKLSERCWSCF